MGPEGALLLGQLRAHLELSLLLCDQPAHGRAVMDEKPLPSAELVPAN